METIPAIKPTVKPRPGYKTTEFWLTLASVLVGSSFLFGVIGSETKDSLTSALQHGVESIFLVGGQVFILCRYIKSRKEVKIAEEVKKQQDEHDALVAKLREEQKALLEAQLEQMRKDYECRLAEARKKKPAAKKPVKKPPTKRKRSNG